MIRPAPASRRATTGGCDQRRVSSRPACAWSPYVRAGGRAGTTPSAKNPIVSAGVLNVDTSAPQGTMFLRYTAPDPNADADVAGPLTSGGNGLTYGEIAEKAGGQQGQPPASAPSGGAVFLIDTELLPQGFHNAETYLFVDDSCSPSANGGNSEELPSTVVSGAATTDLLPFAYFPVASGSHQIVLTSPSTGLAPTCEEIKPASADETTVRVETDDSVLVLPYGIDKAHLKIATGVIH
jgi:hypothetical protein